ncbi:hypothetical protein CONLIGDRAFT_689410 [Coniochaeta ligniaria NRRL 30616]|uniref:HMG box domain-containing protein n=1 Tax=Coniochaeta ligniaria NRRL 30616 TaxID=1408157 RepID=A0A1J7K0C5_9PEZI|nr:hypothetical protein CONLIGDRAFT_689410 [Coniochaeta ligniaria NRRL 30616]
MWTSIRSTAARQLRVSRAATVNTGLSVSSRVAIRPAIFKIPSSYRLVISSRSFSDTSDQLAAKAAAKPAAKKTKTTATKKKPAAKKAKATKKAKKPAVKKAAPKKRVKKTVDPEAKRRAEVRELKKVALLQEPKRLPDRPWLVYTSQNVKSMTKETLGDTIRGLAVEYNSLSTSDKARLEITASENKLANDAAYRAWVESHSPVEIDAANRARQRLRRLLPAHKKGDIKDDRLPKQPASPYAAYIASRWKSGELAGESFKDASSDSASKWKSMSAAEKKEFQDIAAADSARYAKDVKSVLKREVHGSPSP